MANIANELDVIRKLNYGGDMPNAIADALEKVNTDGPGAAKVATLTATYNVPNITAGGQSQISAPLATLQWSGLDKLVLDQKYLGILTSGLKYSNDVYLHPVILSGCVLTDASGLVQSNVITTGTSGPNPVNLPYNVYARGWVYNGHSEALTVDVFLSLTLIPINE